VNKAQRGKLHRAINGLTGNQVAGIVQKECPRAKGGKIDQLAKAVVANAHRIVSPRKIQRGLQGTENTRAAPMSRAHSLPYSLLGALLHRGAGL